MHNLKKENISKMNELVRQSKHFENEAFRANHKYEFIKSQMKK